MVAYPDTITVYNHYKSLRVDYWQRTVLTGVYCVAETIKSVSDGVMRIVGDMQVIIPYRGGYLSPLAFAASRAGHWTLNANNNQDAIVYGKCTQEISSEYTLDDLISEYGAKIIKGAVDYTATRGPAKHWEATCI